MIWNKKKKKECLHEFDHEYEDIAVDQNYNTYQLDDLGNQINRFWHTVKFVKCKRCGHRNVVYMDELAHRIEDAKRHAGLQKLIGKWKGLGVIKNTDVEKDV